MIISSDNQMTEEIALQKENYELGFHLIPDLTEDEVKQATEELASEITKNGGLITFTKEPQRFRLAYPIKHKLSSYFGFIIYSAPKDSVLKLQDTFKLNTKILRYVIVKKEERQEPEVRTKPRLKQEEKPAAKPTEVDKQLEEIIENL